MHVAHKFKNDYFQVVGSTIVTVVLTLTNVGSSTNTLSLSHNSSDVDYSLNHSKHHLATISSELQDNEETKLFVAKENFQYCGAQDCQNAEIVNESLDQYVPTNKITLYVLTGCFVLAMILGLVIHAVFVPEMQLTDFNQISESEKKENEKHNSDKKTFKTVGKT